MESPGRIVVLPPPVAAQIAAGEVITRPWAAVKELVENSLDAGARAITVEIAEGGRRRLRVVDDGCGMTRQEAVLSLERHATSKLHTETDLLNITTLGFRGEALPSIAAVSRLELITCPLGEATGCRLKVVAGDLQESSPWAAAPGTQISVEDLFFNTPARRKFLRSREAEQAAIVEGLRHLALGYPEVHFQLAGPQRTLISAPATPSLAERVAALWGTELAGRVLPFALEGGPFKVSGLMSDPDFSVATTRFQVLLVNRRVVHDRILAAVLKEVYQGLLPRGRHAVVVVHLSVPPELLDVNVHPAKTEVRFQDSGRIYGLLLGALRQGLGPLRGETPRYTVTWQPGSLVLARDGGAAAAPVVELPRPGPPMPPFPPSPAHNAAPPTLSPVKVSWRFQDLQLIGQLQGTYILAQSPEGLVLIDQHAAHERVLYELLRDSDGAVPRQALLFSRVVEVPAAQAEWVQQHLEDLARAGLVLEHFGGASFLLTAAPAGLAQGDLEAALLEAVETLAPHKSGIQPHAVQEQTRISLACHGAIKAGQELSREEMQALLRQLDGTIVSSHCPHGRPLWRLIPFGDIRHSFRRPR